MLKFNILGAKGDISPGRMTHSDVDAYNKFYADGRGVVNIHFARLGHTKAGTNVITGNAGEVWSLNESKRYEDSRKVDRDEDLFFLVLNEKLKEDPNNILHDDDKSLSAYSGATTNAYWGRFAPLRPAADKVVDSIREYLKVR